MTSDMRALITAVTVLCSWIIGSTIGVAIFNATWDPEPYVVPAPPKPGFLNEVRYAVDGIQCSFPEYSRGCPGPQGPIR